MKELYIVIYNILTWGFVIYSIRRRKGKVYTILWMLSAISALFCLLSIIFQSYLIGNSATKQFWYDLSDTTLWGYLLIVLCNYIAFKPFSIIEKRQILTNFGKSNLEKSYMKFFAYGYLLLAFLFILLSFRNIISAFQVSDYGALRTSLYANSDNESTFVMTTNVFANICFKMCLQLKFVSVFVAIIMFKENYKRFLSILLAGVTFFIYFAYASGNAARGGILVFAMITGLILIMVLDSFSKSAKRKIIILVGILGALVVSFFITVSVSRVATDLSGGNLLLKNFVFYLGHGPIEFSRLTGSLNDLAYGKVIIGRLLNHYFGMPYSWEAIQLEIGYPSIGPLFITYLGFLYVDFGIIGCVGFVSIWSILTIKLLKKGRFRLSTAYMFLYYMYYFVQGTFSVGRLEYAALITTTVIGITWRLFENTYINQRRRVRI